MTEACLPRSPAALLEAIAAVDPEHNPDLKAHDVTGDGLSETFCNVALELILERLGLLIPRGLLATYQCHWFDSPAGRAMGWQECTAARAMRHAEHGLPVVACWENKSGPHSHVMVVTVAPPGATEPYVAQAGAKNFNCEPIWKALGRAKIPKFHFHS